VTERGEKKKAAQKKRKATKKALPVKLAQVLAWFVIALIAGTSFAALDPPSPTPTLVAGQEQQPTGNGQEDRQISDPLFLKCHTFTDEPKGAQVTNCEYSQSSPDQWSRALAALTLLVIAGQLIVYWKQKGVMQRALGETKRTVDTMEKNAEKQLRAHVFVEFSYINNVADPLPHFLNVPNPNPAGRIFPNDGPMVYLQIKNFGQTPAYDVIHWATIHFDALPLAGPLPQRVRFPQIELSKNMIGPSSGLSKNVSLVAPLAAQQIADLRARTAAIYVYGIIVYKDAFGKRRRTRYRMMHIEAAGRIGISTMMTGCGQGNDAV
jgi:hypothetical protein